MDIGSNRCFGHSVCYIYLIRGEQVEARRVLSSAVNTKVSPCATQHAHDHRETWPKAETRAVRSPDRTSNKPSRVG